MCGRLGAPLVEEEIPANLDLLEHFGGIGIKVLQFKVAFKASTS